MIKLENWTEITKGLYRYVVAAGCYYEIHIIYHAKDTDILEGDELYKVLLVIDSKMDLYRSKSNEDIVKELI